MGNKATAGCRTSQETSATPENPSDISTGAITGVAPSKDGEQTDVILRLQDGQTVVAHLRHHKLRTLHEQTAGQGV